MAPSSSAATLPHGQVLPVEACVLCGGTRRTYLFVVGRSRMTRCDECQLVFRTDEGRLAGGAESYAMDDDSERAVRGMLAGGGSRRKVLVIVDRGGPHATLRDDPRLDLTTM